MKPTALLTLLIVLIPLVHQAMGKEIVIRLSVKAVLNPVNNQRQPGVNEATFANTVTVMNQILASTGRGYRFQWSGNFIEVGGEWEIYGNTFVWNSGASHYYGINFHDKKNEGKKAELENAALDNPTLFGWDHNAINIYITQYGGANWNVCSFPESGSIILVNGMAGYSTPSVVLHEIGHFFNLSHTMLGRTFLDEDGNECEEGCDCVTLVGGGDDGVADTKLDHECWDSLDAVAQGNFNLNFDQLNSAQSLDVTRIWRNVMSYHVRHHNDLDILTPDQMDRWSDTANTSRINVVSGRTRFVDYRNSSRSQTGSSKAVGGSGGPFRTLLLGIQNSTQNDIILIRNGTYNEPQIINMPRTFRATRGAATVE